MLSLSFRLSLAGPEGARWVEKRRSKLEACLSGSRSDGRSELDDRGCAPPSVLADDGGAVGGLLLVPSRAGDRSRLQGLISRPLSPLSGALSSSRRSKRSLLSHSASRDRSRSQSRSRHPSRDLLRALDKSRSRSPTNEPRPRVRSQSPRPRPRKEAPRLIEAYAHEPGPSEFLADSGSGPSLAACRLRLGEAERSRATYPLASRPVDGSRSDTATSRSLRGQSLSRRKEDRPSRKSRMSRSRSRKSARAPAKLPLPRGGRGDGPPYLTESALGPRGGSLPRGT